MFAICNVLKFAIFYVLKFAVPYGRVIIETYFFK